MKPPTSETPTHKGTRTETTRPPATDRKESRQNRTLVSENGEPTHIYICMQLRANRAELRAKDANE